MRAVLCCLCERVCVSVCVLVFVSRDRFTWHRELMVLEEEEEVGVLWAASTSEESPHVHVRERDHGVQCTHTCDIDIVSVVWYGMCRVPLIRTPRIGMHQSYMYRIGAMRAHAHRHSKNARFGETRRENAATGVRSCVQCVRAFLAASCVRIII